MVTHPFLCQHRTEEAGALADVQDLTVDLLVTMHGLNILLTKPSHLLVLRELHHAEESLTGREIQRRIGLSNRATMLALESLVEASAVRCESTPQANWYEINSDYYVYAKGLAQAFESEDLFWDDLRKLVRRILRPRPIAAVATGPLTRDESQVTGRLELTLLFQTARNRIRAYQCADELVDAAWDRYSLNVDLNWLDVNSVDREENEPLWRRIEREGVLLYGTLP